MSRKNLSRTIIEGGRTNWNKYQRRASHGEERAQLREWLDEIRVDPDTADDSDPVPRRAVGKVFHDKLGPPRRWLNAQVGRPWSLVYRELRARFDRRTITGAHVVDDHMMGWVYRGDLSQLGHREQRFDFFVDAHGILRRGDLFGRSYYRLLDDTRRWADDRLAASTYRGWLWFRRERVGPWCVRYWECKQPQHHALGDRRWGLRYYHAIRYVVAGELTRGERRRLDALPDAIRDQFVIAASEVGM